MKSLMDGWCVSVVRGLVVVFCLFAAGEVAAVELTKEKVEAALDAAYK